MLDAMGVGLRLLLAALALQGAAAARGRALPRAQAEQLLREFEAGEVPPEVAQQAAVGLGFASTKAMVKALRERAAGARAAGAQLAAAAAAADPRRVRDLLGRDADPNGPPGQVCPLVEALSAPSAKGSAAVSRLLLAAGADPAAQHCRDSRGRTPLMLAATRRDGSTLRLLLEHEAVSEGEAAAAAAGLINATALHMLADSAGRLMRLCSDVLAGGPGAPRGWAADAGRTCSRAPAQEGLENESRELFRVALRRGSALRGALGARDGQGRRALDIAALHGDAGAVTELLAGGATDPDGAAAALAAAGGHAHLAPLLPPPADRGCPSAVGVAEGGRGAEAVAEAVRLRRPLLVRGGWGAPPALPVALAELVAAAGAEEVAVAAIPYAERYGEARDSARLSDFAGSALAPPGAPCPQPYALATGDTARRIAAAAGVHAPPPWAPAEKFRPPQLMVGPPGSGSPAHFHQDAFNLVLGGAKRWLLWPPAAAFLSKVPAEELFAGEHTGALSVEQEPGDVVYIPEGWGHAALNTAPTLSVAFEFYR